MSYFEENGMIQQDYAEAQPEKHGHDNDEQEQKLSDGVNAPENSDAFNGEGEKTYETPQAEPESKKELAKRNRRKKAEEPGQGDISGEYTEGGADFNEDVGDQEYNIYESEGGESGIGAALESPDRPRGLRRNRGGEPTFLDGDGRVINDRTDSGQHDLSVLTAARNSRRILSATLDGYEADGEIMPRAVFYLGDVKVVIPFTEMGLDMGPDDADQIEARMRINSMLGAKFFYMVLGVDVQNRIAGASRRRAMLLRRRGILNAKNPNGDFRIREGTRCTAQILHVAPRYIRVEIYGMETYIYIGSISNLWVNDIREVISVGEERPVEIVEVVRDPQTGEAVSIQASLKLAEDKTRTELAVNHTYTGNVTGFSNSAYFVRAAGIPKEIRCPIKSNHVGELMEYGDYIKFYVRAIHDGVPTGAIVKILKKARDAGR